MVAAELAGRGGGARGTYQGVGTRLERASAALEKLQEAAGEFPLR